VQDCYPPVALLDEFTVASLMTLVLRGSAAPALTIIVDLLLNHPLPTF
jgi:hypothetical protein